MSENFEPETIESAVARIAEYAREHKLIPGTVCDIFSAGLCAARIFRAELAGEEIEMHNVEVEGRHGSGAKIAEGAPLSWRPSRTTG